MELADVDPKYTKMCSERTLQEEEKGFFNGLIKDFSEESQVIDWTQEMWAGRVYGINYVTALVNNENLFARLNKIFAVQSMYRRKNLESSMKARKMAGKELTQCNFTKALTLCNQAVILSPCPGYDDNENGCSLAMALWLRAECLMKMNNCEMALRDLQASMKLNLPSNYRAMLFYRQGECYKKMGELSRSTISYKLAIQLSKDHPKFQENVKSELMKIKSEEAVETKDKNNNNKECIDKKISKMKITNFIGLDKKEGVGRYAISTKDLQVGEEFISEEPYAACLKHTTIGTHCNHCFEKLHAPYGCTKCANLAFCSPKCRDEALSTYHKYECGFMDLFIGSGMSVLCRVALMMVTQKGLNESLEIYDQHLAPKEQAGVYDESACNLNMDDKKSLIYNLCTHTEQRDPIDYFKRAMMAFFLLRCLQNVDFFKNDIDENKMSKDEIKIMALLLYHVQMLQFNAHEIEEVQINEAKTPVTIKTKAIGVGIYPTVSLFNHDCHQGVSRCFVGKKIVLRALKPIAKGEMLPENYGPIFTKNTKYARQRILRSRYWFKCQCQSCVEIWPNADQMKLKSVPILRCREDSCVGKVIKSDDISTCIVCKKTVSENNIKIALDIIEKCCIEKYNEASLLMEDGKYEDAIQMFVESLKTFHNLACLPHKETHIAENNLKRCYNAFK